MLTPENVQPMFADYVDPKYMAGVEASLQKSRGTFARQSHSHGHEGYGGPPPAYESDQPQGQRSHAPTRRQSPAPESSRRWGGPGYFRVDEQEEDEEETYAPPVPRRHPNRHEPSRSSGVGGSQGSRRSHAERPSRHYGQYPGY